MLTHLIQSSESFLFLIDEPDIYLHSDLQRQLLGPLRNLGPDILIATHSTEIINEEEADDIILINKNRTSARRIREPSELRQVFTALGSNINPIFTQLAKTRKALFVEGYDFQILSRFAQKLGFTKVANRNDFAVIPVGGFNPERIWSLKGGMEAALGLRITAAALMDKDFRCDGEREAVTRQCQEFCAYSAIHGCKEIENFLLVPAAMDRAAARRTADRVRRGGNGKAYDGDAAALLDNFASEKKSYVSGQYIAERGRFQRGSGRSQATVAEAALTELEACWKNQKERLSLSR
jgi:hypothetical protein